MDAFKATNDGYSADFLIVNDSLDAAFIDKCHHKAPSLSPFQANWILLNLRKSGKLGAVATRRLRFRHDEYRHAAEIAARRCEDRFDESLDKILCDPVNRSTFDKIALAIYPDIRNIHLRLAALGLRKGRKLRPELFTRLFAEKQVNRLEASQITANSNLVPNAPGIYLIYDRTDGLLYIGEAERLRPRIIKHLDHSDRKQLAHYFWANGIRHIDVEYHSFPSTPEMQQKKMRVAYEGAMIESRNPHFNIRGK